MSGPNESIDSVLKPQPIPWSVGSERRDQIYDAAGDHVATMGNGFNSLAQDIANALLVVESVNDRQRLRDCLRNVAVALENIVTHVAASHFDPSLTKDSATSFLGVEFRRPLHEAFKALGGAK